MSKRQSAESRIITYFESAPLASVEIVLGIVREKVRSRVKAERGTPTQNAKRKSKRVTDPQPGEYNQQLQQAVAQ